MKAYEITVAKHRRRLGKLSIDLIQGLLQVRLVVHFIAHCAEPRRGMIHMEKSIQKSIVKWKIFDTTFQ